MPNQKPAKSNDMPQKSHTKGPTHPHNLCIHFITYGNTRGRPSIPMPVILHGDLSHKPAPPSDLCRMYTGASRVISDYLFSIPAYETSYREGMRRIESQLLDHRGGCVAVVVNCKAGMHRSVAMAERMARRVRRRGGVEVQIEHLDTDVENGVRRVERAGAGMHGQ